jgi:hypothetical protein
VRPLPGDSDFPAACAQAQVDGFITEDELAERLAHHHVVEISARARALSVSLPGSATIPEAQAALDEIEQGRARNGSELAEPEPPLGNDPEPKLGGPDEPQLPAREAESDLDGSASPDAGEEPNEPSATIVGDPGPEVEDEGEQFESLPPEEQRSSGAVPVDEDPAAALRFLRADEFLGIKYPEAETLLGEGRERLLPRASFLLVVGDGGDGKSTLTVDGVAHCAAPRAWLGITVPRPVRFCVIENEGPAELFQQKLRDKRDEWDADPSWLENVFVYAEPWGTFSLATAASRAALREFCVEYEIDVVVANPLFGIGGPGAGKPDETNAFVEHLKEVGLWRDVAFWLLHHVNKAADISGDWKRHADTVIRLERDGDQPRTKLRWVKTRWATTPSETRPAKQLLGWIDEHKGYELLDVDLVGNHVSNAELQQRLDAYLAEHPGSTTKAVYSAVTGDNTRLKKLLEQGEKAGTHHKDPGARGAKLWSLLPEGSATSDATSLFDETATSEQVGRNAHE